MERNEYEYRDKRVCEYWLQIESCRKCLFEVLCNYKKNGWADKAE